MDLKLENIIFPNENTVIDFMRETKIKRLRLYITSYLDVNGNTWGFSKKNINSDYNLRQKVISRKTKTFILN